MIAIDEWSLGGPICLDPNFANSVHCLPYAKYLDLACVQPGRFAASGNESLGDPNKAQRIISEEYRCDRNQIANAD